MAILQTIGSICYNNADLIRDGYIYQTIAREYLLENESDTEINKWERKIKTPKEGIRYTVERDEYDKLIKIRETKKLLPANKIKIEIKFSKTMANVIWHPVEPGAISIPSIGGSIIGPMFGGIAMGGITSSTTNLTFHICDTRTIINYPIKVTEKIKETGIIELKDYPLSIFAIIREWTDSESKDVLSGGLQFTDEQLEVIGKFNAGSYLGIGRADIQGATDSKGRFGGRATAEVKVEEVIKDNQEDIFIEILRDRRKLKFRGDNLDASGVRYYPFVAKNQDDATDKIISIDSTNIEIGETLYGTFCVSSKDRFRQCIRHIGKIGQGNAFGVPSWTMQIGSELDVFDYQVLKWKVPSWIPEEDALDEQYKLNLTQYFLEETNYEVIEGWRLSDINTEKIEFFWAADYRGILLFYKPYHNNSIVLFPRSSIRDQDWFTQYLKDLSFTKPTAANGEYTSEDLEVKLDDKIRIDREPGFLIDINDINNSLFFDREKVGYYRPFALALKKISKYNKDIENTGIGLLNLDFIFSQLSTGTGIYTSLSHKMGVIFQYLEDGRLDFATISNYYSDKLSSMDLSYSVFQECRARPLKTSACEEEYKYRLYYNCDIYNPGEKGENFYSRGYIENELFGWRPEGGSIESYWLLSTPYFCDNFTTNSRIYIEDMGGDSLNNFSMIYVDTGLAIAPSTISLDYNLFSKNAILVFTESTVHNCTCFHKLNDGFFEIGLQEVKEDYTKTPIKEDFEHNKYRIIGYNNILGDSPSYSNGEPVSNDFSVVSHDLITDFYNEVDLFDSDYGLDFSDVVPKIELPEGSFIKDMTVKYEIPSKVTSSSEREVSLYFRDSNTAINNFSFFGGLSIQDSRKLFCAFYSKGPVEFQGEYWKEIEITDIKATIVDSRLDNYKIFSSQNAIVNQETGKILIFYADEESSNISVALSLDEGKSWIKYTDIIKLTSSEKASLPFAIKAGFVPEIHLFYILNDSFLMYKKIDSRWFDKEDAFIKYNPPGSYNVDSDDSSLVEYTYMGKVLRQEPSYFVIGNSEEDYFQEQIQITEQILESNKEKKIEDRQPIRFNFIGYLDQMQNSYSGESYAVHIDNSGITRLFYLDRGRLYIRRSVDFRNWEYDIQGVNIHKDFIIDKQNQGETIEIKNIQVIRNYGNTSIVSLLYFHNGMLFLRNLQSNMLFSQWENGYKDESALLSYLDIKEDSGNKPIFLIGNIPTDIKEKKKEEIDNNINGKESELAIIIPYDKEMIDRFNDDFILDTNTQAYGYTTRIGLTRVFYKDIFGNLNGLIINGLYYVTPEIFFVPSD